jgi:apolipoprotein D and lipocalin family protein
MRNPILASGLLTLMGLLTACATQRDARPALRSAASVDLDRYMGAWHVIGRIDYFGERGDVASQDVYTRDADGNVDTEYRYRKSFDAGDKVKTLHSLGIVQPDSGNAFWRIRFLGLLKADYLILDVADDYSWALIGQPDRKLGWIFGREAIMSDALYVRLLDKMRSHGYDASKILRVAQAPEQLGKPGFHP